jgi:toxin ParE1/3/4
LTTPAYRLTHAADRDIERILEESAQRFGPSQRDRYAQLIEAAAELVAAEPERPGSRPRRELGDGVRSFHVELAARRRGAASHLLYYVGATWDDDSQGVVILRVLHEAMEPHLHLIAGLD